MTNENILTKAFQLRFPSKLRLTNIWFIWKSVVVFFEIRKTKSKLINKIRENLNLNENYYNLIFMSISIHIIISEQQSAEVS